MRGPEGWEGMGKGRGKGRGKGKWKGKGKERGGEGRKRGRKGKGAPAKCQEGTVQATQQKGCSKGFPHTLPPALQLEGMQNCRGAGTALRL